MTATTTTSGPAQNRGEVTELTEEVKARLLHSFRMSLAMEPAAIKHGAKVEGDQVLHAAACAAADVLCSGNNRTWNSKAGGRAYGRALAYLTMEKEIQVSAAVA